MPRQKKFPLQVRCGPVSITIYETPRAGREYFTVAWREQSGRKRQGFADLAEAEGFAGRKAKELAGGDSALIEMTAAQAREYREAKLALNGASLMTAVQFFLDARRKSAPVEKTVREVFEEFVAQKEQGKRSKVHLADLTYRCGKFAEAFGGPVTNLRGERIQEFLAGLNLSGRSQNNFRGAIQNMLRFAKRRKYLPADFSEMEAVEKASEDDEAGEIEIFKPEEMRRILAAAPNEMQRRVLAIGAFAGLRTSEILRLDWADVEADCIVVRKSVAKKTRSRRIVPIQPNLRAWLGAEARGPGRVWPHSKPYLHERQEAIAADAGVKWRRNGLRHSFISYRVARENDVNKVALEAGNSPSVIFSNYRELVRPKEAEAWFGIAPGVDGV